MMEIVETIREERKKKLVIAQMLSLNNMFLDIVWEIIKPYVEEIAEQTRGEYTANRIYWDIFYAGSMLFVGYMSETAKEGDNPQELLVQHLKKPREGFVGYFILKPDTHAVHLWQAYIMPEYQNTNVAELGLEFIKEKLRAIGTKRLTMSSYRDEDAAFIEKFKFKKQFTVYDLEI